MDGGIDHGTAYPTLVLHRISSKTGASAEDNVALTGNMALAWSKTDNSTYTYTYSNLPAYDAEGFTYTYWVTESTVTGYTTTYTNTADGYTGNTTQAYNNGTITNTKTGTTSLNGTKVWVDGNNTHTSSSEVTLTLYRISAKENSTASAYTGATVSWSGNSYSYSDLPAYDAEGYAYTYYVEETPINGFATTYENTNSTVTDKAYTGGTIRNTKTGTTSLNGTKVWVDGNNTHTSSSEVTLTLYRISARENSTASIYTGAAVSWSGDNYSYSNLPAYDTDGYAYTYYVEESPISGFATTYENTGANTVVTDKAYTGGTMRNTKTGMTSLNGTKVWVDGNNMHTSSSEVTLTLYRISAKKNSTASEYTGATVSWSGDNYSYSDLPAYDAEGYAYTYYVVESPISGFATIYENTGTNSTVTDKAYEGGTITNELITGDLKVTKSVISSTASDHEKLFHFKVTLTNGNTISGTYGDMTFTAGVAEFDLKDTQSAVATGLPAGITFIVAEDDYATEFDTTRSGENGTIEAGKEKTASYVNTRREGDLSVEKNLQGEDGDPERAFEITVTLSDTTINGTYGEMKFADGVATFSIKADEKKTAKGLPAKIGYTVEESADQLYTLASSDNLNGTIAEGTEKAAHLVNKKKGTIDKFVHDTVDIYKEDKSTRDPLDGAEFTLYSDETCKDADKIKTYTGKKFSIDTEDPELANYLPDDPADTTTLYLKETKAPEGYVLDDTVHAMAITMAISEPEYDDVEDAFIITTTYSIQIDEKASVNITNKKTEVKVSKVDVADGKELEGATIQILDKDGKVVAEWTSGKEAHEVTGLLTAAEYTLHEEVAPDGYCITAETHFTIDETGKVTSKDTKIREDGVMLVEDAMTSVKVSKVDVADGKELEGATIQILDKDGKVVAEWTSGKEAHEVTGLLTAAEYTLHEEVAPDGYCITAETHFTIDETGKVTSKDTKIREDGVMLVEDAMTSVKVSKVDVADGKELEGATIQILDKDGKVVAEWTSGKEAHEVTGLLTAAEYTLHEEVAPDGYCITAETHFTIDETGKVTSKDTKIREDGVMLVEDAMTSVKVSKVDVADGKELEGATIQILDKDGKVVEEWTSGEEAHEITGLKTGEEYTLRETVAPEGYCITTDTHFTIDETGKVTSKDTTISEEGVLLVEDAKTSIKVQKTDITDNEQELSGAHIQILDKEGNIVEEWVSEEGKPHEITGLKTGEEYTLRETVAPEGYDITTDTTFIIDETGKVTSTGTIREDGVLLVEDAKMPLVSATVKKVWDDDNNRDDKRSESLKIELLADGEATGKSVTLSNQNGWIGRISELPKCNTEGKEIKYTWAEPKVEGYTLSSTVNGTLTTLTNTYGPEKTKISVQKIWVDNGKHPEEIQVRLYAEGQVLGEAVKLNEGNGWKYSWDDLCKYEAGKEIRYTVAETEIPEGYEAKITGNMSDGYVITNTLQKGNLVIRKEFDIWQPEIVPEEEELTTEVQVVKIWDDNDNRDGNRPEKITVRLYAGGKEIKTAELSAANGWKRTFGDLPKFVDGHPIHYSVKEDPVKWYVSEIRGFTITNRYQPEVTSVAVRKEWDDNGNEKHRPKSIRMKLSNGMSVELTAKNGWTGVITELPKYVDGKEAVYTWSEPEVFGYQIKSMETNGSLTVITNEPYQKKGTPKGKTPKRSGPSTEELDDYRTPLGVNVMINHVGDCFD